LLLGKVPNYDIQIGFRHFIFPSIRTFHIQYAIAVGALQ
jgi:hypothetical protein